MNLGDFSGPVVASDEAFFLFIDGTPGRALAGQLGGLVGLVLVDVFSGHIDKQYDVTQIDYATLPTEITHHDDWPLKKRTGGKLLLIPRAAIRRIENSFWGSYDLHCGSATYCVGLKMLTRFRVVRFLESAGWKCSKPPLYVQLAPIIGLILGGLFAAISAFAVGAQNNQRHGLVFFACIGAFVGCVGTTLLFTLKSRFKSQ